MMRAIMDIECYWNYFLISFLVVETGQFWETEMYPDSTPLDMAGVNYFLSNFTVITFNGNGYDMPMVMLAGRHVACPHLKVASDNIIKNNLRSWQFLREYQLALPPTLDHIDLIEVAPGMHSLKMYGGQLHSRKLQDLPFDEAAMIEPHQRPVLREYCRNDLITTRDLMFKLWKEIELRADMSVRYGVDLRSKSDAQIAEAVFKVKLGVDVVRPVIPPGTTFYYKPPAWVSFQSPRLQTLLYDIMREPFVVNAKGGVDLPTSLDKVKIPIGAGVYRLGIGGLHSSEQSTVHYAGDGVVLSDIDVASYYPTMILNLGMSPTQIGARFAEIYREIYTERLAQKAAGNTIVATALKIVLNGTFGKLGSIWSIFYAPDLLIQTTVTGQLSLLMLIEALELNDLHVVNANTDGIVVKCQDYEVPFRNEIVKWWEATTNYVTEENKYSALFSRDVNNYLAVKLDGSHKGKGAYEGEKLNKNPQNLVCTDAVIAFLSKGVPIEYTIGQCQDVRKFLTVRKVNGGAVKGGAYLGKAIRWYYAAGELGAIHYQSNGNRVARSEGGRPLMELPDAMPGDLDRGWYVREAYSILGDMGFKI